MAKIKIDLDPIKTPSLFLLISSLSLHRKEWMSEKSVSSKQLNKTFELSIMEIQNGCNLTLYFPYCREFNFIERIPTILTIIKRIYGNFKKWKRKTSSFFLFFFSPHKGYNIANRKMYKQHIEFDILQQLKHILYYNTLLSYVERSEMKRTSEWAS